MSVHRHFPNASSCMYWAELMRVMRLPGGLGGSLLNLNFSSGSTDRILAEQPSLPLPV